MLNISCIRETHLDADFEAVFVTLPLNEYKDHYLSKKSELSYWVMKCINL